MAVSKVPVRIRKHTVEKYVGPEAESTAEKYRSLSVISVECDFTAPKVLSVDSRNGVITLERIRGIISFRDIYCDFMQENLDEDTSVRITSKIGETLGHIHNNLKSDREMQWRPSAEFAQGLKTYGFANPVNIDECRVQLHGDYGFANVWLKNGEEKVVVIDPCNDGYSCRSDWNYGPIYLDIGKMLLSLEGKVPLQKQPRITSDKVQILQGAFLDGYKRVGNLDVDIPSCFAYSFALASCYFSSKYPILKKLAIFALYNSWWKKNFPLHRKITEFNRKK